MSMRSSVMRDLLSGETHKQKNHETNTLGKIQVLSTNKQPLLWGAGGMANRPPLYLKTPICQIVMHYEG